MTDEDVSREDSEAAEPETLEGEGGPGPVEDVPAPATPDDTDPGLTARLKALRPDDEPVQPDAPLWAFERSGPSESPAARESSVSSEDSDEGAQVVPAPAVAAGAGALAAELADDIEEPAEEPSEEPSEEPTEGPAEEPSASVTEPEPDDEVAAPEESAAEAPADDVAPVLDDTAAAALAAATVPAAADVVAAVPREVDMGPEGPGRAWVWALVALAALSVIGAGVYGWWWATSRPIAVPDVVGKRPAEATKTLYEAALSLGTVSEVPTDTAPAGTVVTQVPSAASLLRPGDPVAFAIATEPSQARVPDVTGGTVQQAESTLAEARLSSTVVSSYNATVPVDGVITQLPVAGSEMPAGAVVVVVGSRGPAPATTLMPKVTGLNESEAVKLIQASNLKAAVYRSINASVTSGEVMAQSPAARASVPYGSTVQVLVSQGAGSAPVTVPNVVGLSSSSATKKLQSAKLKASTRTVPSSSVAKGNVISQLPAGGAKAATGATVGLLVSAGNVPTVAVPSVVGTDTAGAKKALQSAQLTPVVLEIETAESAPGLVFSQFPAAGQQYGRYFPAIALVAKAPQP